ncbi:YczE/YyaS/YitT family protein, partial [Enterococcus faecium]
NAVATAAYIGVHLGPGPRDGLMTGLVRRTGRSVRLVRTSVEVAVVATGWLLGGTLGLGTVVYALAIGPLVQVLLPRL